VIGISRDVASGMLSDGLDPTCLYFPSSLLSPENGSLLVRFKGNGDGTPRAVVFALEQAAPDAQVIDPMEDVLDLETYMFRIASWVSSFLGVLALVLTFSGIYGVMAYLVSQRTREIGIRIALGASHAGVVRIVLASTMKLVGVGIGAGLLLALGLVRIFGRRFRQSRCSTALHSWERWRWSPQPLWSPRRYPHGAQPGSIQPQLCAANDLM